MIAQTHFFVCVVRGSTRRSSIGAKAPYEHISGVNPRALLALGAGVFAALIGLILPDPRFFLYDYAWFVGFGTAALLYVMLMVSSLEQAAQLRWHSASR